MNSYINNIKVKSLFKGIELKKYNSSYSYKGERSVGFFTKGPYHIGSLKESMDAYTPYNIDRCLLCITVDNNFDTNTPTINDITNDDIKTLVDYAKLKGWKVTIKLHNFGEYDGNGNLLTPSDAIGWLNGYYDLVDRISNIAVEQGLTEFIISNEMSNVTNIAANKTSLQRITNNVKNKGLKVSCSVNIPEIYENDGFQLFDDLDFYCLNAYPRLTREDKDWAYSNRSKVKNGFYADLDGINYEYLLNEFESNNSTVNKPIWITEFGCMPSTIGLSQPAFWGNSCVYDEEVQSFYMDIIFDLFEKVFITNNLKNITLWCGNTEDYFSLIGKQAQKVLDEYWK